ncbi:TWiK family of potassium channels protein 7-like isoform X2 [Daphnia carinata]|uniref:TWiK family of potassium channels protein 7-like isoform X2 n=1 Tax=Daphnia carinata TaxID=120202 RepID=UPI002869477F|nr:TWiK family of potassium channels protein 7-like isoform X2 [Daphnia carinata]
MSSAGNTFLRLNSTVSQPGSPTSLRGAERLSMMGSPGDGGVTIAMIGTPSVNGAANGTRSSRCGGVIWRYLSSNPRLRKGLAHAGLVVLLCLYTAAGASVFQWLEQPHELEQSTILQNRVVAQREELIKMWKEAHDHPTYDQSVLEERMSVYEDVLQEAVSNRVPLQAGVASAHWTYTQSVFFASTVLTTIGYGNIAPQTTNGRIFCIFFALIGIPFTLTVIADLGMLMASAVAAVYHNVRQRSSWTKSQAAQTFARKYGKSLSVVLVVALLIVYIAIGGGIFMIWEDWNFLESFYFCFITMTTIGFGDLVPAQTTYMLVSIAYILVGLALTTSIIELIRRQYAQSWKKMQELTNRLQGLTGPLAETLRRISEQAGKMNADGKLDPALLKELADLKFALNAVNAEMKRPSVTNLLQQPTDEGDVFGSSTALDDFSSNGSNSSNAWPMEWDECWEERWAAIEEMMISNKAFKDRVMRILSQTSIKV